MLGATSGRRFSGSLIVAVVAATVTASGQVPSFSQPPVAPLASPAPAVTFDLSDPQMRICTQAMYNAVAGGQHHWYAQADDSGSLTVTLTIGRDFGGGPQPISPGSLTATIFDASNQAIGSFTVTVAPGSFAPPAKVGSQTVAAIPGDIYRVQVSGSHALIPTDIYRLKFDGAVEAALSTPSSSPTHTIAKPGFNESDCSGCDSRWVVNVGPGEPLTFQVLAGAGPDGPSNLVLGENVRVFDPDRQLHLASPVASGGSQFTVPNAGNTPGPWVVQIKPTSSSTGSKYRLTKVGGSDDGVYAAWYTSGALGGIDLLISSPPSVSQVDMTFSVGGWAAPQTFPFPTNFNLVDGAVAQQVHLSVAPPPGWTAVPSELDVPFTCDRTTIVRVDVKDLTPPVIDGVSPSSGILRVPNHKMVPISIEATASDALSGPVACVIDSVGSNEPIDGLGDGDTSPDWLITGPLTVDLRAERAGTGSGRVYSINVKCTDSAGNSATSVTTVTVPKSQRP
jgi:hypothetical protein